MKTLILLLVIIFLSGCAVDKEMMELKARNKENHILIKVPIYKW